ncbi:DNA (cytosine-5-)-methyltransferase [bacterium]|nr:MAG: DNA (cytosine-5-)-methyltransferase [bacterium]
MNDKNWTVSAIDLFCGVGGMTRGLIRAGIEVIAGFDTDETCRYAYEANNESSKFHSKDVKDLSGIELKKIFGESNVRILVGCAPCQPFSSHTQKNKNREKDEKWGLLDQFGRLVGELKPDIVSMENVPQIEKSSVFKRFISVLEENEYQISTKIVFCPNYGIPQTRTRLVLLASKYGPIELLPRTTSKNEYKTVGETIRDLEPIEAGQVSQKDPLHRACGLSEINMKRMKQSKPGGTWRDWDESLLLSCHKKDTGKSYCSVYGRMKWDEPSPTITTQFYNYGTGRFGHPEQNRALSLREGALLQTFPRDYKFIDPQNGEISIKKLGIHIGNAVPVDLAYIIGKSILEHLEWYYAR